MDNAEGMLLVDLREEGERLKSGTIRDRSMPPTAALTSISACCGSRMAADRVLLRRGGELDDGCEYRRR